MKGSYATDFHLFTRPPKNHSENEDHRVNLCSLWNIIYIYVYFTTKVDMTEYKVQHNIQEQNANYKLLDREE